MKQPNHISLSDLQGIDFPETFLNRDVLVSRNITPLIENLVSRKEAYRLGDVRIALMVKGQATAVVNTQPCEMGDGDMVLDGSGALYEHDSVKHGSVLPGVILSHSAIYNCLKGDIPSELSRNSFSQCISLTKEEQEMFCNMVEGLYSYASHFEIPSRSFNDQVAALLHFVSELIERKSAKQTNPSRQSRMESVYRQFIRLVAEEHGRRRALTYYANKLCVSTHYLSLAVSNTGGVTAKQFIDEAVVNEVKVLLRHSTMSIAQIAEHLEFPNDSFMCKFFRRHAGISPLAYRKK